jgi:hypothetical protein
MDLEIKMITETPGEFKCPSCSFVYVCPFRIYGHHSYFVGSAGDVDDIRDHCLADCNNAAMFQYMKETHETTACSGPCNDTIIPFDFSPAEAMKDQVIASGVHPIEVMTFTLVHNDLLITNFSYRISMPFTTGWPV